MNELFSVIKIAKTTGTHSDILAAVGLADLLLEIPGMTGITLVNTDADFEIRTSRPIGTADILRIPQVPGYPFVVTGDKVAVPAGAYDVVDYKAEKAKADRIKQAHALTKSKSKPSKMSTQMAEHIQQEQMREDWRSIQVLNVLQGDEATNKMYRTILACSTEEFQHTVVEAIIALEKRTQSGTKWVANLVQLFTPNAAKGYCRLKPDKTDRNDKSKEQWSDAFIEWLKYRGYFRVACPRFFGSKGEHIRLLFPLPADISAIALESLARQLRKANIFGGPPKIDSLSILTLAELLIRHSEEYHDSDVETFPGLSIKNKSPDQLVKGVMITNYQSMGSSKAVSAMSIIGLPGWFLLSDNMDAKLWLDILYEHQQIIRGLQDDHSDEIGLLISYRRFLEQRGESSTWKLLEFMEAYGPFLIRARDSRRKLRAFRTDYLRRIVMATIPKLSGIFDDPGFAAIAAAVRKSTVSAQALKAMGKSDYREIRYELLHDLRRKRNLPGFQPLVEAVSDFVQKYNFENARRREQGKSAPKNITTEEFSSFVRLIETFGASCIGALLCAYGSCREPRDSDEDNEKIVDDDSAVAVPV